ncbi:phosphonate metabolism protein/1,5-bisphosphokinase (PRPP-forming) PhnN [Pseudomonas sp. nanlin1]|uniref:phosphonate metabolism protein/1,5-bisphosphokinase (PRPP-forming) PhnN n=1 Tax=Pseudomonas sp. nanlin1 TaxID=3040605 RepID=UPI00388DBDBD
MSGRLVYLMGPSGSGKDSLIEAARGALKALGVTTVRRVITRSAEAVGEEADGVSSQIFAERQARGDFAMHWQANGLRYGIPASIDATLAAGGHVLVNGSRAYLPQALSRYPDLLPIVLRVDDAALRRRLVARGRESSADIDQRLARNAGFASDDASVQMAGVIIEVLDNSDALERTLEALLQLLANYGISATAGRI